MKYKVTVQGWVVISILLLLIVSLVYQVLKNPISKVSDINSVDIENINELEFSSENNNIVISDDSEQEIPEQEIPEEEIPEEEISEQEIPEQEIPEQEILEQEIPEQEDIINEEIKYDFLSFNETIYYEKNDYVLDDEFLILLDNIVSMMEHDDTYILVIEGHINGYPYYEDGEYGLNISWNRAAVIYDYFINKNINKDQITIINMGSTNQIIRTDNVAEHYLNRRAYLYFKH